MAFSSYLIELDDIGMSDLPENFHFPDHSHSIGIIDDPTLLQNLNRDLGYLF